MVNSYYLQAEGNKS